MSAALDSSLRALADPNRRRILDLLRSEERSVGDIAADADLSQQAASHHLRVLRDAELVAERRDGTRHLFIVRRDGFAAVESYLSSFWPAQLDRLKRAAETSARGVKRGRRG